MTVRHSPQTNYAIILLIAAWTIMLWACTDSSTSYSSPTGHIKPRIEVVAAQSPDISLFTIKLIDDEGRFSKEWNSYSDFPVEDDFLAGSYTISATFSSTDIEGHDKPCYSGETKFTLGAGDTAEPLIECRLANTPVNITIDPELMEYIERCSLDLRSSTGNIITVTQSTASPIYLKPGMVDIILHLSLADGRTTSVLAASFEGEAGIRANVELTATGNILDIDVDGQLTTLVIDDALFDTPAPEITPFGWVPDIPLVIEEGRMPSSQVAMDITSAQPLRSLMLTVSDPHRVNVSMPQHTDLMNPEATDVQAIQMLGLTPQNISSGACRVDLSRMLSNVAYSAKKETFTVRLLAVDRSGHVSGACTLYADILPAELSVESCSPAVIGINMADMVILAPDADAASRLSIFTSPSGLDNTWIAATVTAVTALTPPRYRVTFTVPPSVDPTLKVKAVYLGNEIATMTVNRVTPDFTLAVDAFACTAKIKVIAADPSLTSIITRLLRVYADHEPLNILERDEATGTATVGGLEPATSYRLRGSVMTRPSTNDFSPETEITTEIDRQIPNHDFNDMKIGIEYEDMAAGGRYSQTIAPVINCQNRKSFKINVPDYPWANTNAKTFCRRATHHNTWFMQPSVEETSDIITGDCSVKLTSVAWDPSGQAIPDYVQTSRPYLAYNPYVPKITFRAAGKIFLGTYSYTPTDGETYNSGITFRSRPLGLNVTYRYLPGPETPYDRGYIDISVLGNINGSAEVIASGKILLPPSSGFSTVNIPLDYNMFGIKATKIKVTCSSSENIGTIAHESATIITTDDLANSCSRGSVLEIKDLRLSY